MAGAYINPYARILVQNPEAKGIMLDTTWKLLQHYVVSIPEIIITNIGLPIGFSFGIIEDSEIYNIFFDFFEKTYHFQITDYIKNAESDQGTGLAKCIKNQGMKHLKCLRHLLVSLGKGCFSEQIGNLVSVTSKFDFKELKKEYNSSWRELTDAKMIAKLERNLNKVGLTFQNQQKIKVKDDEKWDERSMVRRAKYQMPSCTNQLESTHGHMNSQVPRRNSIWPSMNRICQNIMTKIQKFEDHYKHNYYRYKNKIKNTCSHTPEDIMRSMINHYQTDINTTSCLCGESILISSMLGVNLPCSHLFFLGMEFPKLEAPNLNLDDIDINTRKLIYKWDFVDSHKVETNDDYFQKVRQYTSKVIRRYSHHNKKEDVEQFVLQKLPFTDIPTSFILGYPKEIFSVIHEGILHFTKS